MAKKEKNILQDAVADAKALKEAAMANAQTILMEHLKGDMKQLLEQQINENYDGASLGETDFTTEGDEVQEGDVSMTEMDLGSDDELDLDVGEEEEDEDGLPSDDEDMDEGMYEGLTEDDLAEALESALSEVTHGGLGDMEWIHNEEPGPKHATGLEDLDSKEEGWEEKTAPKSTQAKLHTGEQYHQEAKAYRVKVASLVKENTLLKKVNKKLATALKETQLFNSKLYYASKLMQHEGLNMEVKRQIVNKMDGVKSLAEAKNLYSGLEIALSAIGGGKKAKAKKFPSLHEAVGSNIAGPGAGVSKTPEQLNEGNYQHRNQVLAGIIKE